MWVAPAIPGMVTFTMMTAAKKLKLFGLLFNIYLKPFFLSSSFLEVCLMYYFALTEFAVKTYSLNIFVASFERYLNELS